MIDKCAGKILYKKYSLLSSRVFERKVYRVWDTFFLLLFSPFFLRFILFFSVSFVIIPHQQTYRITRSTIIREEFSFMVLFSKRCYFYCKNETTVKRKMWKVKEKEKKKKKNELCGFCLRCLNLRRRCPGIRTF